MEKVNLELTGVEAQQFVMLPLDQLMQHKGPIILSGYPSELYERELNGWSRITRKSYNQNADQRTEVLWCNFEVGQISMFDGGRL